MLGALDGLGEGPADGDGVGSGTGKDDGNGVGSDVASGVGEDVLPPASSASRIAHSRHSAEVGLALTDGVTLGIGDGAGLGSMLGAEVVGDNVGWCVGCTQQTHVPLAHTSLNAIPLAAVQAAGEA